MGIFGIVFLTFWILTLSLFIAFLVAKNKMKSKQLKPYSTEFNQLALSVGLNKSDIKEIKALLTKHGVTKPYLIFSDPAILERIINDSLKSIEKLNISPDEKEKQILRLFEIRRKIYNHYVSIREGIHNTREIESNQLLSLDVYGLGKYYCVVILNDKKNLIISLPEVKDAKDLAWKDKAVQVYFWRYNDAGYVFKTIIENMVYSSKLQALLLRHKDKIKRIQRREYPRRKSRFDAKFFKFSISTNEKGKPVVLLGKTRYGVVIDISPSGASLVSEDPIRQNSAVKLEFEIEENPVTAYGKMISMAKKKNVYVMHIQFQRISDRSKNLIYRFVYNY